MRISIVTAARNSADTLDDTIKSVLGQTYQDFEHIIVDGQSTDRTLELIESYRSEYGSRLKVISEPDQGIYDAMNKGIALASGDIVGLLNSDDFFTRPTVLQRIVEAFAEDNAELQAVYGDIMYVDAANLRRVVRYYSSAGFRRWKMRLGFMPAHPSFYCRRELYDRHGNFSLDFPIGADFENLLRIIYLGRANCHYLPMNFVTMRMGGASTSGLSAHRHIYLDHVRAYRKNGIKFGPVLDLLRYPVKIAELISYRLQTHKLGHED